jgi:hypothetical protein
MSRHLKAITDQHWGQQHYLRLFGNSLIQDAIINELLRLAPRTKNPLKHLKEVVDKVLAISPLPSAGQFEYNLVLDDGTEFRLSLKDNKPAFQAAFFQGGPSFRNVFLHGESGTGKSMILNHLAFWGFKAGFLVVNCREAEEWTQSVEPGAEGRKLRCGLFLQQNFAKKWLGDFLRANQQALEKLPVSAGYGRIDYAGVHADEYEPVPNIYYKDRDTYFNDPDQLLDPKINKVLFEEERIIYLQEMRDVLPAPRTLAEICKFGIDHPKFAVNAIAEVLHQLKSQDQMPVLMVVDNFNFFYRPTRYKNYKYQNEKSLRGCIPPNHLALSRLFMNLNGHEFKRGVKIVASSPGKFFRHRF